MNKSLYIVAGALLLIVLIAAIWLLGGGDGGNTRSLGRGAATASNPALDLRYRYPPDHLTPAPFDPNTEFPLRLDGEGWSFYGKRIRGMGRILKPGPMLYDLVGSEHNEVFESWYKLRERGEPLYEDATFGKRLGLHTATSYERAEGETGWPFWFPDAVRSGDVAYLENWALLTEQDLFFFYAVSARQLTEEQRKLAEAMIEHMEFGALVGTTPVEPEENEEDEKEEEKETVPLDPDVLPERGE